MQHNHFFGDTGSLPIFLHEYICKSWCLNTSQSACELTMSSQWCHGGPTVWDHTYDITVRSWWAHMNSQFYLTRLTVWDHNLISLWDHSELTWTHSVITLNSRYEIIICSHCEIMVSSHKLNVLPHQTHGIIWSLTDLTVRSFCAHMSSQFYHTELTAWDYHLISLWYHGELAWTQCFITLDSQFEIIIWSHFEIMLYSHELTALSHWTHGMISLSDLTVRSWWAHMNSMFYHIGLTVWDHYLISLWDHAVLIWAHSFITPDKRYEIMICSHCEIMVSLHELTLLSH